MRGRPMSFCVELTPAERAELERWQRTPSMHAGRVRRARAMLMLADGAPLHEVVKRVGMAPRIVRRWARRFIEERLGGLNDRPRPGRTPVFSPRRRALSDQAGV